MHHLLQPCSTHGGAVEQIEEHGRNNNVRKPIEGRSPSTKVPTDDGKEAQ